VAAVRVDSGASLVSSTDAVHAQTARFVAGLGDAPRNLVSSAD